MGENNHKTFTLQANLWSTIERLVQELLGTSLFLNSGDQWTVTFIFQWLIMSLQLCQFVSSEYLPYAWSSPVVNVFLQIIHFVTEFWFSSTTNYYISVTIISVFLLTSVLSYVLHHKAGWTLPFHLLHWLLSWVPSVLYLPLVIPHIKIVFPCLASTAAANIPAPFYEHELICWRPAFMVYWVFSVLLLALFVPYCFMVQQIYYSTEIPGHLQWANNAINACVANDVSARVLLAKTVVLVLCIAGNARSWRVPMAAILCLTGGWYTERQVRVMPFWSDRAQILYNFQALLMTWVGFIAMLMSLWGGTYAVPYLLFT